MSAVDSGARSRWTSLTIVTTVLTVIVLAVAAVLLLLVPYLFDRLRKSSEQAAVAEEAEVG
jgi:hypothetical protein